MAIGEFEEIRLMESPKIKRGCVQGFGRLNLRMIGPATDGFQGTGDAIRVAGKLNSKGIGQKLTLARQGGLNQLAEKITEISQYKEGRWRSHKTASGLPLFSVSSLLERRVVVLSKSRSMVRPMMLRNTRS